MKRILSLLLAGALALSLAGCKKTEPDPGTSSGSGTTPPPASSVPAYQPEEYLYNLWHTTGPTTVAFARLHKHLDEIRWNIKYPEEAVELDGRCHQFMSDDPLDLKYFPKNGIAMLPAGTAAQLYHQHPGELQMLAITNLGNLQLLAKGEEVHSLSDLRNKTIYVPADNRDAEAVLRHLLVEEGLDPDRNVKIDNTLYSGVLAEQMEMRECMIGLLDGVYAAQAVTKAPDCTLVEDLAQVWKDYGNGDVVTGCVMARTKFVEDNPEVIQEFLLGLGESVIFMADPENLEEAVEIAEAVEFMVYSAPEALPLAISQAGLVFATGQEMKDLAEVYYLSLYQADPGAMGGGLPYDNFYYGVE